MQPRLPELRDFAVHYTGSETWRFGSDGLIASSQGSFDAPEYRRQLQEGI
jgi:hypothetical protein